MGRHAFARVAESPGEQTRIRAGVVGAVSRTRRARSRAKPGARRRALRGVQSQRQGGIPTDARRGRDADVIRGTRVAAALAGGFAACEGVETRGDRDALADSRRGRGSGGGGGERSRVEAGVEAWVQGGVQGGIQGGLQGGVSTRVSRETDARFDAFERVPEGWVATGVSRETAAVQRVPDRFAGRITDRHRTRYRWHSRVRITRVARVALTRRAVAVAVRIAGAASGEPERRRGFTPMARRVTRASPVVDRRIAHLHVERRGVERRRPRHGASSPRVWDRRRGPRVHRDASSPRRVGPRG